MKGVALLLLALVATCISIDPMCPYPSKVVTYLPNRDDCQKFFECRNGEKCEMDCPPTRLWNQRIKNCDYICDFGDSTILPPPVPTPEPTFGPAPTREPVPDHFCDGQENGSRHADPRNCRDYILCDNGFPLEMKCPNGTYWDVSKSDCIWGSC